jgi:anti-anti-sigma factor
MDSTGLSTLVPALREVEASSGTVSVNGANDRIIKLFRIGRLDAVISMRPEDRQQET